MLKLKVIACDVMNREVNYIASQSKCYVDVTLLNQGLHNTPDKLREIVQQEIDKANGEFPYNYYNTCPTYDYIILGYGLCSNGIIGLKSSKVPLVVPRAHDCITLFLGSKEAYSENFRNNPGTYWFSSGWIERAWQPSELKYQVLLDDYTKRYGEDNAEFLMEMEQGWLKEYKNAGFIYWSSTPNIDYLRQFTKDSAAFLKWNYVEFLGNDSLLNNMLNGIFNDNEVLIVPPTEEIAPSYDESIICLNRKDV